MTKFVSGLLVVRRKSYIYFEVATDLVDDTRVGNGADCVQLQIASNMRTITV